MQEVQVGDIGTQFLITLKNASGGVADVSDATVMKIIFGSPRRVRKEKDAIFLTDGTDGKIKYITTSANDIDEPGVWQIQAFMDQPSGEWHSSVSTFMARENI